MYQIISVPDDAPEQPEQLGTKPKFWFRDKDGRFCLFKQGRPNTGENWAEKIACEICTLLGIPHSEYDLAIWKGRGGVVSPTFVSEGSRLVFGNELLAKFVEKYEGERRVRAVKHTIGRVMAVMRGTTKFGMREVRGTETVIRPIVVELPLGFMAPPEVSTVAGVFVGYLMLDALIGNQDRHDENWGLILSRDVRLTLAPTFDHASSLGRNESDNERSERLSTRDEGRTVERYVERARSAFYGNTPGKPLTTLVAFQEAARISEVREAKRYWVGRLKAVSLADFREIFDNVPSSEISEPARDFGLRMLEINRERLLRS